MRVVFMGTPDIAATCLKKILEDGFEVVACYTQPDRPKGRGMKMVFSAVKEVALAAGTLSSFVAFSANSLFADNFLRKSFIFSVIVHSSWYVSFLICERLPALAILASSGMLIMLAASFHSCGHCVPRVHHPP